jgi:hypothetical protein
MSSRETYLRTGLRSLGRSRSSLLCFNDTRGEASAAVATFIHVALRQMLRPYPPEFGAALRQGWVCQSPPIHIQ